MRDESQLPQRSTRDESRRLKVLPETPMGAGIAVTPSTRSQIVHCVTSTSESEVLTSQKFSVVGREKVPGSSKREYCCRDY